MCIADEERVGMNNDDVKSLAPSVSYPHDHKRSVTQTVDKKSALMKMPNPIRDSQR
jgi:hypothetical protein